MTDNSKDFVSVLSFSEEPDVVKRVLIRAIRKRKIAIMEFEDEVRKYAAQLEETQEAIRWRKEDLAVLEAELERRETRDSTA